MTNQEKPPADATERAAAYEKATQEAKKYLEHLHGDDAPYRLEMPRQDPFGGRRKGRWWEKPFAPIKYSPELFVPRKPLLWPSMVRVATVLALLGLAAYVAFDAYTKS